MAKEVILGVMFQMGVSVVLSEKEIINKELHSDTRSRKKTAKLQALSASKSGSTY